MSLTVQFQTMAAMIAMGVWIGSSIDTYHRFSKKRHHFHWMTALTDFLFWVIQGLIVFYVLLLVNEGQMRFYIIVALLCGFAAYKALFQKTFLRILEGIIQISIAIYRFFKRFVQIFFIIPIRWILKLLYSLCIMVLSALFTVMLFLLKIIWIPIKFIALKLYKLTRLDKLVQSITHHRFVKKIVKVLKAFFQRDDKGE